MFIDFVDMQKREKGASLSKEHSGKEAPLLGYFAKLFTLLNR
jgi:hypothetical protein